MHIIGLSNLSLCLAYADNFMDVRFNVTYAVDRKSNRSKGNLDFYAVDRKSNRSKGNLDSCMQKFYGPLLSSPWTLYSMHLKKPPHHRRGINFIEIDDYIQKKEFEDLFAGCRPNRYKSSDVFLLNGT